MFIIRGLPLGLAFSAFSTLVTQAQNVGVGTTNPSARLHIVGPTNSTVPILQVEGQGSATPFLLVTPTGNVGINVNNPAEVLDIGGNIQFSGALMPAGNAGTTGQVLVSQGPGTPPLWQSIGGSGGVAGLCSSPTANYVQKWMGSELCNSVIYDDGSNVGIGTNSPTHTLHVAGSTYIQDSLRIDGDFRPGGNPGVAGQVLVSQGSGMPPQWQTIGGAGGVAGLCNAPSANYLQKWTGTELCNSLIYDDGTNVGIGTSSPTQKLDVAGNIQFSGALMPGGNPGSAGQVLVSQGPGSPPQWQYLSSPGVGSCVRGVTPCVDANGNTGSCPAMSLAQCITACRNSTYGGFTDWRVPSIDEYHCLFSENYTFDNASNYYWTVSPSDNYTYAITFPSGGYYYVFKPNTGTRQWGNASFFCRCVR